MKKSDQGMSSLPLLGVAHFQGRATTLLWDLAHLREEHRLEPFREPACVLAV